MRTPARKRQAQPARVKSYPAPTSGWIANQNLAAPGALGQNGLTLRGASHLENWFPTATGIRMRGGSQLYATLGSAAVRSMFTYSAGNAQRLFAATDSLIYDATTIADPALAPPAVVSGLTSGKWSVVQFATSAGTTFLRCVNGRDAPRVFDGTTWGTAPAITGPGLSDATLSHVWNFKQRLLFTQRDTLDLWYLPVDAIGGAAARFPMGGIFQRGGSLLFGSSWSIESGSGPTDVCVIVTTEGEVAVYQGTDPVSWALSGLYRIGRPLGPQALTRAGGDIIIATDVGAIPLSQAMRRDFAVLAGAAVSNPIETAWVEAAKRAGDWHAAIWPKQQLVAIIPPRDPNGAPEWFVANANTGAWAKYTGWDGTCLAVHANRLFFGTSSGKIIEAEVTGADQGATYTAAAVAMFDDFKAPAHLKIVRQARAVIKAGAPLKERLSIQRDFAIKLPPGPDVGSTTVGSVWGSGKWGESTWGGAGSLSTYQVWRSVSGAGSALAPAVQVSSGGLVAPEVELVRLDVTYDRADPVT